MFTNPICANCSETIDGNAFVTTADNIFGSRTHDGPYWHLWCAPEGPRLLRQEEETRDA